MNKKKAVDYGGSSIGFNSKLSNSGDMRNAGLKRGFANGVLVEPVPKYIKGGCEKVIKGSNNTAVVLGRDRPSSRLSGYGGRGDTQAGAIDMVAGRMGFMAAEVDEYNEDVWTDPNMQYDAARVLVSQKTDVDDNFGLSDGIVGNAKTRSAVSIKADGVRIIGREGIKLVTKTDTQNSQGGPINAVYGIDLIAGNDDRDMQPIPKGKNLTKAMESIVEQLKSLTSLTENFITNQMKFNNAVMRHTHVGNLGAPVVPSTSLIVAGALNNVQMTTGVLTKLPIHRANMEVVKLKYLNPLGNEYINSRHNHTN